MEENIELPKFKKQFARVYPHLKLKYDLLPNDYLLLTSIHQLSKKTGWCICSKEHFSKYWGISKTQVYQGLKRLEGKKLIERGGKGLLRATEKWNAEFLDTTETEDTLPNPKLDTTETEDTQYGSHSQTIRKPKSDTTETEDNNINKNNKICYKSEKEKWFDDLIRAYKPNRIGPKGKAWTHFNRFINTKEQYDELREALVEYKCSKDWADECITHLWRFIVEYDNYLPRKRGQIKKT